MTTFVWSIDDAGMGGSAAVETMPHMDHFLESRGLQATWFVVPRPQGKDLSPAWLDALHAAREAGHDLQLHGLTHEDCFEFGPPNWPATSIRPQYVEEFAQRRSTLIERYTVERLQARLEEGMAIFARDLGVRPTIFRAPCGAISKAMFEALRRVGIGYHSCQYISGSGYNHLPHASGVIESQWTDAIPHRPFRWYADVIEAPILNEYTWRGSGQRSDEFVALAKADIDRIVQESPVAVILMHTHGLADDYDHAFRLVDAILEHTAQSGQHQFATFDQVIRTGALAAAATAAGADCLAI